MLSHNLYNGAPSDEMCPSISFPFQFPSVELLSDVITPSYFSSAYSSPATRSPVSLTSFQSQSPTILFMLSIICLRYSTSPSNLANSLLPFHANTQVPDLISAQELVHLELSNRRPSPCRHLPRLLDGAI